MIRFIKKVFLGKTYVELEDLYWKLSKMRFGIRDKVYWTENEVELDGMIRQFGQIYFLDKEGNIHFLGIPISYPKDYTPISVEEYMERLKGGVEWN